MREKSGYDLILLIKNNFQLISKIHIIVANDYIQGNDIWDGLYS